VSGTDDNHDDDGANAADEIASDTPKTAAAPEPPPVTPTPATGDGGDLDVDEMWGMAPPPPVGQAVDPAPEPADPLPPSALADDPLEPMPDYAAEANRWREELTSAVDGSKAKPAPTAATTRKHIAPPRPARRLSARNTRFAIGGGIGVVLIGVIVALGWFNSRDYYLVCATEKIGAERGRKFPPWGTSDMSGATWTPIKIPRNTECTEYQTSDVTELEAHFLDSLLAQANAMLASAEPANIELAEAQLKQAFLLTRTPERRDKRKEVERLVGDVEYWRAAAQVRAAVAELGKAGEQFEGAAKRLPRHQTDSSAWAEYTRHVSEELLRGPPSLRPAQPATIEPGATPPFKGTGPDSPVHIPDAGVPPVDAQPGTMLPPITDAAPGPTDAGLPKGGVLL
jgi:hypothetical protein